MKWTEAAEQAVSRVPFFVRKRVKKRVEEEAERLGAKEVRIEHVQTCQKRFLTNLESEVKGYQVETCFGPGGCPNRAIINPDMVKGLEELLSGKDLKVFLKERVQGPLKMHHEFRVCISDCPNACSRPQIVDVGLIGARRPMVSQEPCSLCGSCVEICKEGAIFLRDETDAPVIDPEKCLSCGQCLNVCPTGTIQESKLGYRILIGGKLGRHPQLGRELPKLYSPREALEVIERCLTHYLEHNRAGERFGEILNRVFPDDL